MKQKIAFFTVFASILTFSQIKYEKAYFIKNSGEKIECYIKNEDWRNSPSSFEYKINESEKSSKSTIKEVKLFEIYNHGKYVRSNVQFDQSSNNLNSLSNNRAPEFVERELFLKEIIPGKIQLYKFSEGNIVRFFYQKEDSKIEPLIYKTYEITTSQISYNEDYKNQLGKILSCSSINKEELERLQYNEKSLKEIFIKYYKCSSPDYVINQTKSNQGKFNLYVKPRINFSSLNFFNSQDSNYTTEMDNNVSFGLGLDAEFILPFNKNKWAITVEPTYLSYKGAKTSDSKLVIGGQLNTTVDYKSIEVPIGIRHYMYLNNQSKISINAQYVMNFTLDSTIKFKRNDGSVYNQIDINSTANYAFGLGYTYKNKYGIEFRYYSKRNVTSDYFYWNSNFKNFSIILGYNLF